MPDATFTVPDLTFTCLDELGLVVAGQRLELGQAVLACRLVEPDQWRRRCGCEGIPRDSLARRLAHELLRYTRLNDGGFDSYAVQWPDHPAALASQAAEQPG